MPEGSMTATGVAVGLWLYLLWIWLSSRPGQRYALVAVFGLVCGGALGAGLAWPLVAHGGGASSVAAIFGASVVLLLVLRPWNGDGRWMLDHLVPGGIAALSVARLGCLFDGCDFGRVTEVWPSVVHEAGSRAWETHIATYDLPVTSAESLPVHPFALYLAIWGFMAAAIGEWFRRRQAGAGLAGLVSAGLFFVGAGLIEWLREPATVPQLLEGISAYPLIYWMAALGTAMLWWRWRPGSGRDK